MESSSCPVLVTTRVSVTSESNQGGSGSGSNSRSGSRSGSFSVRKSFQQQQQQQARSMLMSAHFFRKCLIYGTGNWSGKWKLYFFFSPKQRVNVALVGPLGCGKSALTVRFLTKRYIGDYDPTIGQLLETNRGGKNDINIQ